MSATELYCGVVSLILLLGNFLLAMAVVELRFQAEAWRRKHRRLRRRINDAGVASLAIRAAQ